MPVTMTCPASIVKLIPSREVSRCLLELSNSVPSAERKAAVETEDWSTLDLGEARGEEGEVFEEVHEVAGNLLLILAALHVGGVVIESRAMRRNLVRPMLGGAPRG